MSFLVRFFAKGKKKKAASFFQARRSRSGLFESNEVVGLIKGVGVGAK